MISTFKKIIIRVDNHCFGIYLNN